MTHQKSDYVSPSINLGIVTRTGFPVTHRNSYIVSSLTSSSGHSDVIHPHPISKLGLRTSPITHLSAFILFSCLCFVYPLRSSASTIIEGRCHQGTCVRLLKHNPKLVRTVDEQPKPISKQ
jgi:hypothetical protein